MALKKSVSSLILFLLIATGQEFYYLGIILGIIPTKLSIDLHGVYQSLQPVVLTRPQLSLLALMEIQMFSCCCKRFS